MQRILLFLMLSIFSSNLLAVEIFQGLEVGASHQDVLKKFPSAVPVNNRAFGKEPDNQLLLKNYEIFGESFEVRFTMVDRGLKAVNFFLEETDSVWSRAMPALISKYGKPYYNANMAYRENLAMWKHDGIKIQLQETSDGYTFITYDAEAISDASKL